MFYKIHVYKKAYSRGAKYLQEEEESLVFSLLGLNFFNP